MDNNSANDVILGGTPAANSLAWKIGRLCRESECMGFEMIGALESVKHQLIAEAHSRMIDATATTKALIYD